MEAATNNIPINSFMERHSLSQHFEVPLLALWIQHTLKILHYRADASIGDGTSRASNDFHSIFGNLLPNGDPVWDAYQIGVIELDQRALVAIVQKYFKSRSLQATSYVLCG